MAHKQIQMGSLSNAYKRLTEGGLASHDPVDRLRQLHQRDDLTFMEDYKSLIQHACDMVPWDKLL
jgi:hypothetical protein